MNERQRREALGVGLVALGVLVTLALVPQLLPGRAESGNLIGPAGEFRVESGVEHDVAGMVADEPRRDRDAERIGRATAHQRALLGDQPPAIERREARWPVSHRGPRAGPRRNSGHGSGIGAAAASMITGASIENASSSRSRTSSGFAACIPTAPKLRA